MEHTPGIDGHVAQLDPGYCGACTVGERSCHSCTGDDDCQRHPEPCDYDGYIFWLGGHSGRDDAEAAAVQRTLDEAL